MSGLLLAPYNDSMRLGAGFNSFLQTPCLGNVVLISDAMVTTSKTAGGQNGTSQTVAYSASFVEKMSEVVRAMNISAGSSIRTGSVNVSAGNNTIDEAKFTDSDLNAVLSVKVVNQTRVLRDQVEFNPLKVSKMSSETFHSTYGDTFISGFIEGGDLHGIVSMKIIEASRKSEIKKQIKSQFNGSNPDWSPTTSGQMSSLMSQTEVTITVNYAGGGVIKDASQEWTLQSLVAAASAFPDNVAKCPQRTFAILSRYNTIPSFVEWVSRVSPSLQIRRYEGVQRYTSELLDTFIEYKSNLHLLNDAIRHPELYQRSSAFAAVEVTLEALLAERRRYKSIMETMVQQIESLDADPDSIRSVNFVGKSAEILEPELLRARLPVKKDPETEKAVADMLKNLWGSSGSDDAGDMKDPKKLLDTLDLKRAQSETEALKTQLAEFEKAAKKQADDAQAKVERLERELREEKEKSKTNAAKLQEWADYEALKSAKATTETNLATRTAECNKAQQDLAWYKSKWEAIPEVSVHSIGVSHPQYHDSLINADALKAVEQHIRNKATVTIDHRIVGTDLPTFPANPYVRIIYQRREDTSHHRFEGWWGEQRTFS